GGTTTTSRRRARPSISCSRTTSVATSRGPSLPCGIPCSSTGTSIVTLPTSRPTARPSGGWGSSIGTRTRGPGRRCSTWPAPGSSPVTVPSPNTLGRSGASRHVLFPSGVHLEGLGYLASDSSPPGTSEGQPRRPVMQVSPFAGKPADQTMLVNVPRLVTAYYTGQPDPSVAAERVVFGTSGHRGSSLDNAFNEAHVLAITQAICPSRNK